MPRKVRIDHPERCIQCFSCVFACSNELFGVTSANRTAVLIKNSSPANRPVIIICPGCENPPCVVACKENALEENPEGGLLITKPWKCETCEVYNCAKACSINAIQIDPVTKKPVICTQCGICADFCSHKVISCIEVKKK